MVSVIINTKDRIKELCSCIQSLLIQENPIDELIIVDASKDFYCLKGTLEGLLNESKICLKFFHTKAGNSYQRNVGIKNVNKLSEFVCFIDDDVVLYPDTIKKFMDKFTEYPNVFAVQGIETNRKPQHPLGKLVRKMFYIGYEGNNWRLLPSGEHVMVIKPIKDQYVNSFMTGFVCVKKHITDRYKFDEWFKTYAFLEDYDFSYRIGKEYNILMSPEVKFIHNRVITSRLNTFKINEMFIINKSYFFLKNIDKTFYHFFAYIWSLIGHLILNLGKSIYKGDMGYFLGTFVGVVRLVFFRPLRSSV